ncbi:MAG: bifunctional uridylyltransferase/uridylyl-removing protein, partial [Pseudomonadota bacterium]
ADLFLRLLGFFARSGYNIVDAKIQTTEHGYALDSFVLLDAAGNQVEREAIHYVEHELSRRLKTQAPPEAPVNKRLSRQVKHFPIQATVAI